MAVSWHHLQIQSDIITLFDAPPSMTVLPNPSLRTLLIKESETIKMDIHTPKLGIAFKINAKGLTYEEKTKLFTSLVACIDLKISSTSLFYEDLRNKNLLTDEIEVGGIITNNHILVTICVEAQNPIKIKNLILNELKDLKISKEEFERRKKTSISSLVYLSDNIFKVNSRIVNEILSKHKIDYNPVKRIKSFNYEASKENDGNLGYINYGDNNFFLYLLD